tara:strand:+ start:817 stop:1149 length:333 start_codon:yes stop_codon:yes gene_type:complete
MPNRYSSKNAIINNTQYYAPIRRGKSSITHYGTPILSHPSVATRRKIKTQNYIWKYGDRLYKLADEYYNDSRYWWVIAWYNSTPTEASLQPGDVISIPVELEKTLKILRG